MGNNLCQMFNIRNSPIINTIMVLLFSLLTVNCGVSQERPKVSDGILYFSDGKTSLPIGANDTCYVFQRYNRVVIVREEKIAPFASEYYFEYEVHFYDYTGKEISDAREIAGEFGFWFLEEKNRIIAGQQLLRYGVNDSYIFDSDGNLVMKLIHDGEIKNMGVTVDTRYIWFVSNKIRGRREGEEPLYPWFGNVMPYNHVMIFDTETGELFGDYSVDGTDLEFKNNGVDYKISFSPADFP